MARAREQGPERAILHIEGDHTKPLYYLLECEHVVHDPPYRQSTFNRPARYFRCKQCLKGAEFMKTVIRVHSMGKLIGPEDGFLTVGEALTWIENNVPESQLAKLVDVPVHDKRKNKRKF